MPVTNAWTTPANLDLGVGNILPEATWDNLVSNTEYLWQSLHNYYRPVQVQSLLVGAADVNLYKGGTNILSTDDSLYAGGNVESWQGASSQILLGTLGGEPIIYFGNGLDTDLQRSGASTLRTSSSLFVAGNTLVGNKDVYVDYNNATNKLFFGSAADTNLYRASANQLRTDDSLDVLGTLTAPNVATRLAETVLGSAAGSVSIASIPATYRHLRVVVTTRGDASANNVQLLLRLNGDSGANYSYETIQADLTTVSSGRSTAATSIDIARIPGATAPANFFTTTTIVLGNYRGATWKTATATGHGASSTAAPMWFATTGDYSGTSAITQFTIVPATGNLVASTVVTVYGEP